MMMMMMALMRLAELECAFIREALFPASAEITEPRTIKTVCHQGPCLCPTEQCAHPHPLMP